MIESAPSRPKSFAMPFLVALATSVLFCGLWLKERGRKPNEVVKEVAKLVEVIKEVPVEKIREIPREVIKRVEVPAKLTPEQEVAINLASNVVFAPMLKDKTDALYKLESVNVVVTINDAVKKVVSEERVKNKFELILRRHDIHMDAKAPVVLALDYEGLWGENENVLTYAPQLSLEQLVLMGRSGELRKAYATVWREGAYGYAGKKVAEDAILRDVEARAESFANEYLNARDRSK